MRRSVPAAFRDYATFKELGKVIPGEYNDEKVFAGEYTEAESHMALWSVGVSSPE